MATKKKTEKPGHCTYGVKVRVLHETRAVVPVYYVETQRQGYADGDTVAHYYGPGARRRAYAHAVRLRAALKVVP